MSDDRDQQPAQPDDTPDAPPQDDAPSGSSTWERALAHLRSDRRLAGGVIAGGFALVAVAVLAVVLLVGGGGDGEVAAAIAVSPAGDEAPRLGPVVISFARAPATAEPERLVSIEPAVSGTYAWLDDTRLLFQPDFPGFLRGAQYAVHVDGDAAGTGDGLTQAFTVEGELTVRSVIPGPTDQAVPPEARIFVQFSRSVAPLTLLSSQPTDTVLEFEPVLPGTGEWLNTSLYVFTPDELLPSTTYQARVPAGLTSAADGVLAQDYEWTFSTYQPALASITPADQTSFVALGAPVALTFNQPMDRASVEAGVSMRVEGGPAVAFTAAWSEGDSTVTLAPSQPLEIGTRYQVTVPAGLAGAVGGETAEERVTSFQTVETPRLVNSSPRDGDSNAGRWGISLEFNNPMDIDSLAEAISISGLDAEDWRLNSWGDDRYPQIDVPLAPSTSYTLTINGAVDRAGLALDPVTITFTTGRLESSVSYAIPDRSATYAVDGDQELFFYTTNQDSVRFELFEMAETPWLTVTRNGIARSDWKPDGDPLRTWTVEIEGDENALRLSSTDIGGGERLPVGYYYLRSPGAGWNTGVLLAVTDTQIVTKLGFGELLVWALDHQTGEPLSGIDVTVDGLGVSDQVARTDADGLATVSVPRPSEDLNATRAYTVTTHAGGRLGVGYTAWQTGTEPWLAGVPTAYWDQEMVAHVYTDRPIYRSGETVYFKTVVRMDDDASYRLPPAGDTDLTLVVVDAQGDEVLREPVVTSDFGTFAGEFELPEEAATGYYSVSIREKRAANWENWIASVAFQVAEFRTPEFRVDMAPTEPDVLNGGTLQVDLEASFFFGGPLEGADVTWSAYAYPGGVSFEDYRRYSFSDFDYYGTSVFQEPLRATGEATTDASGHATISVPAALRAGESTTSFEVSATVLDQSGQGIGASATATVHPASVYAGVSTSDYVTQAGSATDVLVATVDTGGVAVPSRPVTVQVYEREWITVKEETASGAARYRSEPRDTLLETRQVTTGEDGLGSVSFTPQRAGSVRIVVSTTDAAGLTARGATYLWVSGGGYAPWRVRNDSIIELIADQESYEVGDTASVLVPAPFAGTRALVTIERGGILDREVRVFETNSETLTIPIEDRFVPNVFVSVTLYRPPTAEDPVPRYHVGYVELPVSTASRTLNVQLQPSVEQAQPGETVRYDITVSNAAGEGVPAELSVVMADAAVLSLSDLVDQTGLQAFWFQRGLAVQTSSSLSVSVDRANDAIPEPESGGKGGGGEDEFRSEFRNTAFWQAVITTDASGHASIEVTLPDNLTTWRTQARAVSGDTLVGEATHELLSTKPLLVRPALPRFARVGDSFALRTLVRNATNVVQEISVSITAEGLTLGENGTLTQMVAPGQSGEFEWPATATTTGTATVAFRATAAELVDAVEIVFPVHLDVTPETTATGGVVVDESALEALYLPLYAITDNGTLDVQVQASIVGALQAELGHLAPQLYEGPMRVASRVIATVAARQAEGLTGDAVVGGLTGDLTKLMAFQRSDGGWAWCSTCIKSDPAVTAWVLTALGDAVDAGWESPNLNWRRGATYLDMRSQRTFDVERPPDPNERASHLYAMQHATGRDSYLNSLRSVYEQDRARLTSWGRAYLILGLIDAGEEPDDPVVRGLMSDLNASVIPSANGNHWEDDPIYGSLETNVSMTSLVMQALVAADPEHPLIEETARWLVAARDAQRWQSTVERAQAIRGLGAYASLTGERTGDFDYRVLLDGDDVLSGHLSPGMDTNAAGSTLPLASVSRGEVHRLSFEREKTSGRMYYVLNLRYVTPAAEVEALSRGLSVAHEYSLLGDPDRPVTQAALGEIVRVTVTVVADADRKFVAVEDFLPAGLEPIDSQLAVVPDDVRRQLEEERTQAVLGEDAEGGAFAPWYRWYWSPWDETNVRDDRFTMFATDLPRGVHEYVYYARATTPGDFFVAPAHAEEGPFPEVFGRSDSGRFRVVP